MASFIGESVHLWVEWLRSEQEERSDKVPRGARMPEQRQAGQLVGHEGLQLTTSFTQAKSATRKLGESWELWDWHPKIEPSTFFPAPYSQLSI